MSRNHRKSNSPSCFIAIVIVLALVGGLVSHLRAPFNPANYQKAIARIGVDTIQQEADQLIASRRSGADRSGNYQWVAISKAPPAIRALPYVTKFSAQEDSVHLIVPDLHFSVLTICHSDQELPEEHITEYSRFRRLSERIFLYEEWYLWP